MKVVAVKIDVVVMGGRHPVLAQVLTDRGLSGVGEAAVAYGTGGWAAAAMIKELAEGFLLGRDPSRIEALWAEMYDHTFWAKGGGPIIFAGISAIEQALWDLKGKALGAPFMNSSVAAAGTRRESTPTAGRSAASLQTTLRERRGGWSGMGTPRSSFIPSPRPSSTSMGTSGMCPTGLCTGMRNIWPWHGCVRSARPWGPTWTSCWI